MTGAEWTRMMAIAKRPGNEVLFWSLMRGRRKAWERMKERKRWRKELFFHEFRKLNASARPYGWTYKAAARLGLCVDTLVTYSREMQIPSLRRPRSLATTSALLAEYQKLQLNGAPTPPGWRTRMAKQLGRHSVTIAKQMKVLGLRGTAGQPRKKPPRFVLYYPPAEGTLYGKREKPRS
jgi:hypothetical protein